MWERPVVIAFAIILGALALFTTIQLHQLQAFAQYNVFFDADSNQYISAVAHGWSFNRTLHPGYALFFNVPVRFLAQLAGLWEPSWVMPFREGAALLLPSISGALAIYIFWSSLALLRIALPHRMAGTLLLAGSFSQMVFGVIPESYSTSGMLFCLVLWMSARTVAAQKESSCSHLGWKQQTAWLALAIAMTGVTVTNGFACVAAWAALHGRPGQRKRAAVQAGIAAAIVGLSIFVLSALDRFVYSLDANDRYRAVTANLISTGPWSNVFVPNSIATRLLTLPAHMGSAIVPPPPNWTSIALPGRDADKYKEGLTLIEAVESPVTALFWMGLTVVLVLALKFSPSGAGKTKVNAEELWPSILSVLAALLAFQVALHATWGREMFLYSQHWLAAVVLVMICAADRWLPGRLASLSLLVAAAVCIYNVSLFVNLLAKLHAV